MTERTGLSEESGPPASAERSPEPSPWPSGASFGPRGLEIGGIPADQLAATYGTPLIVVDEDDLRSRCRSIRSRVDRVFYAVKAFTAHAVIRVVSEEGLDLLVASRGELEVCRRAGARGARIVVHGNNKSDEELASAVDAGVGLVIVDNEDELRRLDAIAGAAGIVQSVLLRVIPEIVAGTHLAIETGAAGSKFGTPLAGASEAVALAERLGSTRFVGLHAHIGSQVLRAEPYLRAADALLDLLGRLRDELGVAAELLDLGGGFGVTYVEESPLVPADVAVALSDRVRAGAAARDIPVPLLAVEPGRSLIANAAVTLYRVGSRKESDGRTLVAVDGGMSDNIRPMLYGSRFAVAQADVPAAGPERPVTVVGKHCESGDVLAENVRLPAAAGPGALLAFASTGAYTYSMASNYNRVGRPAVVAVRGGIAAPWLRREDPADMDRLEVPPSEPVSEPSMPPGVVVRPARPGDAASFLELWRDVVAERRFVRTEEVSRPRRYYRRHFRRSWTNREANLVAVSGADVLGHLHIQRESHPVTNHVATLGIVVRDGWRGRGLGSGLLAEALRWAREMGVEKIVLSVYPGNATAIALYRTFGFVDEGRLLRHSRKSYGYEDEILMARWMGTETG